MNSNNKSSKCIKRCGFFGSPETLNMCSKRYMFDIMANFRPLKPLEPIKTNRADSAKEAIAAVNRCESCRKKVGLAAGFKCRCEKILCGVHRYPEQHSCAFDFKSWDRGILARQVFLVKADKLEDRI